jgi:hypothetical protein
MADIEHRLRNLEENLDRRLRDIEYRLEVLEGLAIKPFPKKQQKPQEIDTKKWAFPIWPGWVLTRE